MSKHQKSLLKNADDSLKRSIGEFVGGNEDDLKYVVLHASHAVELYLKARLAEVHDCLLLDRPEEYSESLDPGSFKTVDSKRLSQRLNAVGVVLSEEQKISLEFIRINRNRIQHFDSQIDAELVKKHLISVVIFLEKFLKTNLGRNFSSLVGTKQMGELNTLKKKFNTDYKKAFELAKKAESAGSRIYKCPSCSQSLLPAPPTSPKNAHRTSCLFCSEQSFLDACDECGDPQITKSERGDAEAWFPVICSKCYDRYYRQ